MVAMVIKLSGWLWLVTLCVASVCCSGCHWFWRSHMFISGYDEAIDVVAVPRGYEDTHVLIAPLREFGSGIIWDAVVLESFGTMSVRSLSGQVLAEYTECQLDRIPARQNRWIVSPSGLYAVRRNPGRGKALRDLLKKRQPTVEPKRGQELPLRRDTGP